jgi:hypothetical protein
MIRGGMQDRANHIRYGFRMICIFDYDMNLQSLFNSLYTVLPHSIMLYQARLTSLPQSSSDGI